MRTFVLKSNVKIVKIEERRHTLSESLSLMLTKSHGCKCALTFHLPKICELCHPAHSTAEQCGDSIFEMVSGLCKLHKSVIPPARGKRRSVVYFWLTVVYFWHQTFLDRCLGEIIWQANSTVFSWVAKAAGKEEQIEELLSSWGREHLEGL